MQRAKFARYDENISKSGDRPQQFTICDFQLTDLSDAPFGGTGIGGGIGGHLTYIGGNRGTACSDPSAALGTGLFRPRSVNTAPDEAKAGSSPFMIYNLLLSIDYFSLCLLCFFAAE